MIKGWIMKEKKIEDRNISSTVVKGVKCREQEKVTLEKQTIKIILR